MVAQTNRKMGNSGLTKIGKILDNRKLCIKKHEKNRKINSTFVGKDSLPAPHQGYNKGYESSASTFAGFRSTFAAWKE